MLNTILGLSGSVFMIDHEINNTLIEKVVINNYDKIINLINWNTITVDKNPTNQFILKTLCKHKLLNKFLDKFNIHYSNIKLFFFTRFCMISMDEIKLEDDNIKSLIIINRILHKLRILCKRRLKSKVINYNIKMYDILREIKTFPPNEGKEILRNGSIEYQHQKQKFTNKN